MNIDIRLSLEFFGHPKIKKLKKRLGLESVFALLKLWAWTAANRANGVLSGLDEEGVELAADWEGDEGSFVSTLCDLRLLDVRDGSFVIHDWEEHQAYASKSEERSSKARKAAESRWGRYKEPAEITAENNAKPMLGDATGNATSMLEHAFSNAPETRNQYINTTPDGVVVAATAATPDETPPLPDRERQPNQLPLPETEPAERAAPQTPSGPPPCPQAEIVALYHEILPELPRMKVWTGTREKHLKARWRECWQRKLYATREEGLAYWRRFFEYVRASSLLMGKKTYPDGRSWNATLEWLVNPGNFAKVIERKYEDRIPEAA